MLIVSMAWIIFVRNILIMTTNDLRRRSWQLWIILERFKKNVEPKLSAATTFVWAILPPFFLHGEDNEIAAKQLYTFGC